MPDGSRVCGCDEQDGLIAPRVAAGDAPGAVLAPGTRLGARHAALMAALGVTRVHVRDRLR
ncbi:hypothetical protein, partial [Falsiroseomonas oryziterrae]|uniref:hypothetical protein n=1 Tax=Falsiroseomonas oryziterrae TaxID=2911368 RepID=UPI001F1D5989